MPGRTDTFIFTVFPRTAGGPVKGVRLAFRLIVMLVLASTALWVGSPTEVTAQASVTIRMTDNFFTPASFSAEPGESVSVTVMNEGVQEHTFTLFAQVDAVVPTNSPTEMNNYFDNNTRLAHVTVASGAQADVTFTALSAEGSYIFVCMVSGHAITMKGVMTVGTPPSGIDPLFLGIVIAVVVIVIAVAAVFILRRRS